MNFKQVKETCIYIENVSKTEAFYNGQLGLEVISKVEGKHVFFKAGSSVLLCFISADSRTKESPQAHYGVGKLHFAFEVSKEEYALHKSKIKQLTIPIIDEVIWKSGQESFYFNDPDGNVLEIVPEGIWDTP